MANSKLLKVALLSGLTAGNVASVVCRICSLTSSAHSAVSVPGRCVPSAFLSCSSLDTINTHPIKQCDDCHKIILSLHKSVNNVCKIHILHYSGVIDGHQTIHSRQYY